MSRIYLRPTGLHSRAMTRVENALRRSLPRGFEEACSIGELGPDDIQVLHVINQDAIEYARKLKHKYVVIQYCLKTAGGDIEQWQDIWSRALLMWSYYDLSKQVTLDAEFYHSPLGIDYEFTYLPPQPKGNYILTHGYVSGPGAEAITDVWQAAHKVGTDIVHIGPSNVGIGVSREVLQRVKFYSAIKDRQLAALYAGAKYCSCLRYIEGFEMPAIEALACYTRPIVFDQPSMRQWYGGLAEYVRDNLSGDDLVRDLMEVFGAEFRVKVDESDRFMALSRFNWQRIMKGFWERIINK